MPRSPLTRRVEILEEEVESLEQLPARIETLGLQILQFREEVGVEFSATRDGLRSEMQQLHGQALARVGLAEAAIRYEINQLDEKAKSRDEETRRFMRMLHEHAVGLIAAMGEGGRSRE